MKKQTPVSIELAATIRKMTEQLKSEFGCDYAFTIMGKGHYVATSNYVNGVIQPQIKG